MGLCGAEYEQDWISAAERDSRGGRSCRNHDSDPNSSCQIVLLYFGATCDLCPHLHLVLTRTHVEGASGGIRGTKLLRQDGVQDQGASTASFGVTFQGVRYTRGARSGIAGGSRGPTQQHSISTSLEVKNSSLRRRPTCSRWKTVEDVGWYLSPPTRIIAHVSVFHIEGIINVKRYHTF